MGNTSATIAVIATRAMWRGGRHWQMGATTLDADQVADLSKGRDGQPSVLELVAKDPNFTVVAQGEGSVMALAPDGKPIDAHTVVVAKRAMWRAGRKWEAGVTPLSAEQVEELGAEKLATLKADPNFTVAQGAGAEEGGDDEGDEGKGLAAKTIAELRAYAEQNKIDLGEATKKADIIAAIEKAEANPPLPPPPPPPPPAS